MKPMKSGKCAELFRMTVEFLEEGEEIMVKSLVGLFNVCLNSGKVPEDSRVYCRGKGYRSECKRYRGISALSILGKMYVSYDR